MCRDAWLGVLGSTNEAVEYGLNEMSRPILVFRSAKVAQIRQVSQLEMLANGAGQVHSSSQEKASLPHLLPSRHSFH